MNTPRTASRPKIVLVALVAALLVAAAFQRLHDVRETRTQHVVGVLVRDRIPVSGARVAVCPRHRSHLCGRPSNPATTTDVAGRFDVSRTIIRTGWGSMNIDDELFLWTPTGWKALWHPWYRKEPARLELECEIAQPRYRDHGRELHPVYDQRFHEYEVGPEFWSYCGRTNTTR